MVKQSTLLHSTIGAAVLSTLLLSTSANAGLLGGGGAAGGLNGGVSQRSLSLSERAKGEATLPRGDKAGQKVGDTTQAGKDAGHAAASKAADTKAAVTDSARGEAGRLQERAGNVSGNASGTAAAGADVSRNAAHAGGTAEVSRDDRSVSGDASARGRVNR
jgi:hypothetical protein